MADLEIAGASSGRPGTDGLTINDLPDEMIVHIFSLTDVESLLVATKVCTRWLQLCMKPYVWKDTYLIVKTRNYKYICRNVLPLFGECLKNVIIYYLNISNMGIFRASCITHCLNLTYLKIETSDLDSSMVLDDLSHLPNLNFLSFNIRGEVYPRTDGRNPDHNLQYVGKNVKSLEVNSESVSYEAYQLITSLIRYCPYLTYLKIKALVDRGIFHDLNHLSNLKFLSLYGTRIIDIDHIEGTEDSILRSYNLPFEKFQYLETLILPSFSLTRDSLYSMLECEHLVSINMKDMRDVPADFLEFLVRTKQSTLQELYIYGDTLDDDILRYISNCRQLQVLSIGSCRTIIDSSLLHLSSLNNLQSLELCHGDFSESAILAFMSNSTFPQMTYLRLPESFPLTSQVIEIIKIKAPNLKEIRCCYGDIKYLKYTANFLSCKKFKPSPSRDSSAN